VEGVNVRRTLIATIGVVALSVLFALPAAGGPAAGFVTVDPASGAPGDPITVSGSCGAVGSGFDVEIHFIQGALNEDLGTTVTQPDGSFSLNAAVPAGAQPGAAEIEAQCIVDSTGPLTTEFTVTAPASPPQPPAPESPASTAAEPVTATPAFTG
jgi:hypothetical protein